MPNLSEMLRIQDSQTLLLISLCASIEKDLVKILRLQCAVAETLKCLQPLKGVGLTGLHGEIQRGALKDITFEH